MVYSWQFDMDHHQPHFDSNEDLVYCSDLAQTYGAPQAFSIPFQDSNFPSVHDNYPEAWSPYNGITPAQPSQPLSKPTRSSEVWPSMLTDPNNRVLQTVTMAQRPLPSTNEEGRNYPGPSLILKSEKKKVTRMGTSSSRKTLTDEVRRQMCQFKVDYPKVKQTEIGAIFGVERSTVSKVLRKSHIYLKIPPAESHSTKQAKSKSLEIQQAIANWACNRDKKGNYTSDAMIKQTQEQFSGALNNPNNFRKTKRNKHQGKIHQKRRQPKSKLERRFSEPQIRSGAISFNSNPGLDQIPNGSFLPPMTSQSNSPLYSTSYSCPLSNEFQNFNLSMGSTSLISSHSPESSPAPQYLQQPRRQTFPSLDATYPCYGDNSLENMFRRNGSCSEASLSEGSPGNDVLSLHSSDDSIFSMPTKKRDSFGSFSSYALIENADHQSLSDSSVPELQASHIEALEAYEFLNYYDQQNENLISPDEYSEILNLKENMHLDPNNDQQLPSLI